MKLFKKLRLSPMEVVLAVFLLVQFLLIAYCNLFLIDENLDCDNAKMLNHIIKMCEHRTLIIPNWSYVSTLEWDCTSLFAIPLYAVTQNIYISCGISNILLTGLFIGSLFFLFKGKEYLYPLVCANLISIPYQVGMLDYFNMMFFAGAQYIVKVSLPIMLVGIILDAESTKEKKLSKSSIFFGVVFFGYLLTSCMSSGIYVVACGIAPVLIAYFIFKFLKWEKVPKRLFFLMIGIAICVLVGMRVNTMIMGGARGQSMVLMDAYQLFANMGDCLVAMFELFGGVTTDANLRLLSLEGIVAAGKIALVVAMLICGIVTMVKCVKKQGDLRMVMLICIFAWNYFVLNVTKTRAGAQTSEYRYHLIGMIPLMCVTGAMFVAWLKSLRTEQQKILFAVACLGIAFISGVSFKEMLTRGEQNKDLKELVEYCAQGELDFVYLYGESNNGDICRLLSRDTQYLCLQDDATVWGYDYYTWAQGGPIPGTNAVVAVRWDIADFGDSFELYGYKLVKFDELGNRKLYCFVE